jgi:hypothetical protein
MNNLMQMIQAIQNPQNVLKNSPMMQNPIFKNAMEMYQRGDKEGINRLADNLCAERGLNRQDIEQKIRSKFGM